LLTELLGVLHVTPPAGEHAVTPTAAQRSLASGWLKRTIPILSPTAAENYAACPSNCSGGTINGRLSSQEILTLGADYKRQVRVSPSSGKNPHMPYSRAKTQQPRLWQ